MKRFLTLVSALLVGLTLSLSPAFASKGKGQAEEGKKESTEHSKAGKKGRAHKMHAHKKGAKEGKKEGQEGTNPGKDKGK